jgi:hypothetical protein
VGARGRRRCGSLLELTDPPALADGFTVDGVLEPFEEGFEMVYPLLEGLDAWPVFLAGLSRGRLVSSPTSTEANDTAEHRRAAHRLPPWIVATGHVPTSYCLQSLGPREGKRKQNPHERCGRTGQLPQD